MTPYWLTCRSLVSGIEATCQSETIPTTTRYRRRDQGLPVEIEPHVFKVTVRNIYNTRYPPDFHANYLLVKSPTRSHWGVDIELAETILVILPNTVENYKLVADEGERDGIGGLWIDIFEEPEQLIMAMCEVPW